ncbi:MAG TPA: GtrA family protein [Candidatus Andersenbacteria bacterium]|nr:GtrA family protein [Candidatus Andersenbacteria bacterium]
MLSAFVDTIIDLVPVQHQKTAKQFIKFGITGAIGAVVDFGTFAFLTRILDWDATYTVFGTEIIAANNVSVFLAICSNFIINRTWTFQGTAGSAARQGTGYFALNIFTWALNQLFVGLFYKWSLFIQLFGAQRDFAAKAAAIIITLFINFFGSKLLIFRGK